MTNKEAYNTIQRLNGLFANEAQRIPARVNFYMVQNVQKLYEYVKSLEHERLRIVKAYGGEIADTTGEVTIPPDNLKAALGELEDLLAEECYGVEIKKMPLSWFDNLSFTIEQMQAIYFMIEED